MHGLHINTIHADFVGVDGIDKGEAVSVSIHTKHDAGYEQASLAASASEFFTEPLTS